MHRKLASALTGLTLGLAALAAPVHGNDAAAPDRQKGTGAPEGVLDLSIRARALGLTRDALPLEPSLDLEAQRAPTGAGTSRWPSERTELGKGMYIQLMPACIPGVDEPLIGPLRPRSRSPRR